MVFYGRRTPSGSTAILKGENSVEAVASSSRSPTLDEIKLKTPIFARKKLKHG
jgi:hypothetical protein